MELSFNEHPSDEIIELYALNRLSESLTLRFEEHLLVCDRCQEALRQEDLFSDAIATELRNDNPS